MKTLLIAIGFLAATSIVGAACFIFGGIVAQDQLYMRCTEAKLAKVRPVLEDPQFAGVRVEFSSAAQVYLIGEVGSQQARQTLEERVRFLFGDEEARSMVSNVRAH
jgi:hypothetical protein